MTSQDPLSQPYRLNHLELRNHLMSTAHEPAYSEDGLPTDRYRLYHVEKARGGIALNMTAGSAVVAEDSPTASGRSAKSTGRSGRLAYLPAPFPQMRRDRANDPPDILGRDPVAAHQEKDDRVRHHVIDCWFFMQPGPSLHHACLPFNICTTRDSYGS